jgi:hypothetical protein
VIRPDWTTAPTPEQATDSTGEQLCDPKRVVYVWGDEGVEELEGAIRR